MKKKLRVNVGSTQAFSPMPHAVVSFPNTSGNKSIAPPASGPHKPTISKILSQTTGNSFLLSFYVDPGFDDSTISLEYGITPSLGLRYDGEEPVIRKRAVTLNIEVADPYYEYYYRVTALNARGKTVREGKVILKPYLSFVVDCTENPFYIEFIGIPGKTIILSAPGEDPVELILNGELQNVQYLPSYPSITRINVTGDLDGITVITFVGNTSVLNCKLVRLTALEYLMANNASLSIRAVDWILRNLSVIDSFPNLILPQGLGLHGQTPAAPPTITVLNHFISAWGLTTFSDVDPQPYNLKLQIPGQNTTANKTVSIELLIDGEANLTFDWGPGTNFIENIVTGSGIVSHVYPAPSSTYLVRISGEVEKIKNMSPISQHMSKLKDISYKNLIGLEVAILTGSSLTKVEITAVLEQLIIKEDFPALTTIDFFGTGFFTDEEKEYYQNLRPEMAINL